MDTILHSTHDPAGIAAWCKRHLLRFVAQEKWLPSLQHDNIGCEGCAFRKSKAQQAEPVSPPVGAEGGHRCYVEHECQLYEVTWTQNRQFPDLSLFPTVQGTVRPIQLSPEMTTLLSNSTLLDYGSDSVIRCSHSEGFPIIKVSHPSEKARHRLHHEIYVLRKMSAYGLPVPAFSTRLLVDEKGVFAYQMERLWPIDFSDLQGISIELQPIVSRMHSYGFSHGDLHPGNVMRNSSGQLTLIDFSHSGELHNNASDQSTCVQYQGNGVFSPDIDRRYLRDFYR